MKKGVPSKNKSVLYLTVGLSLLRLKSGGKTIRK